MDTLTEAPSMVRKALSLASIGLHVFPCKPDTKAPLTPNGFKDATTDPEAIATYWGEHPAAAVGVACGASGIVVADIDDHAGYTAGADTLYAEGLGLPATYHYQTSTGNGEHHVYAADGSDVGSGQPFGPNRGIDRKAGNGYVIWHGPVPTDRSVFADPPAWLLQSRPSASEAPFQGDVKEWLAANSGEPDDAMKFALQAFKGRGHGHMLTWQTLIVKLAAEGHPGAATVLDDAETMWSSTPHESTTSDEWNRALADAIHKFGGEPAPEVAPEPAEEPEPKIKVLRIADLLNRRAPGWWVDGLLQQSTVAVLAGEPGIGKSFLMLDIAARVASGTEFFGRKVKQGRVLYVVAEGAASFGKRVTSWQDAYGDIPSENIGFIETGVNLSDPSSMADFRDTIAAEQADVIILDTLSQLSEVENENDAAQLAAVLRVARELREVRPGSTVLIVHHTNKSEKAKVRGSSAIRGNTDTVIVARSRGEGMFELSTEATHDGKQKDGLAETLSGFRLESHGDSAIVVRDMPIDGDGRAIGGVLADGGWHKMPEFQSAVGDMGDATRKRLARRLTKMAEDGKVLSQGSTKAKEYRRADA